MTIAAFTGVGPRMFEDFFKTRSSLKSRSGSFVPPKSARPAETIRLLALQQVEAKAAELMPLGNKNA